jgi:hypothetical protein
MTSKATTVEEYLAELPDDRRAAVSAVREVILKNLPQGYEEGMQYGMVGYYVPHRIFPASYHCDPKQPLPYVSLASLKNHMALYMHIHGMYGDQEADQWFREAYTATSKKLDMGKACIRFKKLDDLPLEVIGQAVAGFPVEKYLSAYEASLQGMKSRKNESRRSVAMPNALCVISHLTRWNELL